jgi:hypothetical protein
MGLRLNRDLSTRLWLDSLSVLLASLQTNIFTCKETSEAIATVGTRLAGLPALP